MTRAMSQHVRLALSPFALAYCCGYVGAYLCPLMPQVRLTQVRASAGGGLPSEAARRRESRAGGASGEARARPRPRAARAGRG